MHARYVGPSHDGQAQCDVVVEALATELNKLELPLIKHVASLRLTKTPVVKSSH